MEANSFNHNEKVYRHWEETLKFWRWKYNVPGQNVLYTDGHVEFEKTPNVSVNKDNIYTYWSAEENPSGQDVQGGTAPTERNSENDAKSEEDSFLVI